MMAAMTAVMMVLKMAVTMVEMMVV